jgi:hypothetical protein
MKNKWFIGFCILLVFGLALTGCSTDGGGGDPSPETTVYYGVTTDSYLYTVVLAVTPLGYSSPAISNGSSYTITVYQDTTPGIISKGTIAVSGTTVTFTSTGGKTFTAMVASAKKLEISSVTKDDNTTTGISNLNLPTDPIPADFISDGTWTSTGMSFVIRGKTYALTMSAGNPYNAPTGLKDNGIYAFTADHCFASGTWGPHKFVYTKNSETSFTLKESGWSSGEITYTITKQ